MGVTIRDVARHAGVSSGTVSRVLNQAPDVDDGLRRRVLAAVAELGYSPAPTRQRTPERAVRIGFLLVQRDVERGAARIGRFWADILHGAEEAASQRGGHLVFRTLRQDAPPATAVAGLAELRLDCAMVVGPAGTELVAALTAAGLPVVLVDNAAPGSGCAGVLSDNLHGAIAAVDHLLGLGHRDIAFVGGPTIAGRSGTNSIYSIAQRAAGYRTALRERGVEVRTELIEGCDLSTDGGATAIERLLAAGTGFTAVFCANDPTARGALRALRAAGIAVPDSVSVVGFDDDLAADAVPPLTTIRVPREAMGAVAVRTLLDTRTETPGPATAVTVTLPVELIERSSTAAPRTDLSPGSTPCPPAANAPC